MIDTKFLAKALIQGGGAVASLISSLALANVVNQADFALYNLVITYLVMFATVSTLGLGTYSIRYISQSSLEVGASYRILLFLLTLILSPLVYLTLYLLNIEEPIALTTLFVMYGYCFQLKSVYQGENKIVFSLLLQTWILPTCVLIFCILSELYKLNIDSVYYLIISLCSLTIIYDSITIKYKPDINTIKLIFKEIKNSLSWLGVNLIQMAYRYIDILMLNLLSVELELIAIYLVATKLNLISNFLLEFYLSIFSYKKSKLIKSKKNLELKRLYKKNQIHLAAFSIFIFIIYVCLGKYILSLYGNEYSSSYSCLIILSIGSIINNMVGPAGQILNLAGYHNENLKITIFGFSLCCLLLFLLTTAYGLTGTATSITIAVIYRNVAMYFSANKLVFKND